MTWRRKISSPLVILASRFSVMAAALVTSPLVARAIGPEGRGVTSGAITAMAIVPILLGLGMPLDIRRTAARGEFRQKLRSARIFVLATLPVAAGAGWAIQQLALKELNDGEIIVFAVCMGCCPLFVSMLCDQNVLMAQQRYLAVAIIQCAAPLTTAVVLMTAWLGGALTVSVVMLATALGTVLAAGVGWVLVRSWRVAGTCICRAVRDGSRYALSQLTEISAGRLDQLLVVPIAGAAQAGLYSVAVTIATIPLALGHALGAVIFSEVARAGDTLRGADLRAAAFRSAVVLSGAGSVVLVAAVPVGVPLLYGAEFGGSVLVAVILVLAAPLNVAVYVTLLMLGALGRSRRMTLTQFAGLTVSTALLFFLGGSMGAVGAATASVIGSVVTFAICCLAINARLRTLVPGSGDVSRSLKLLVRG